VINFTQIQTIAPANLQNLIRSHPRPGVKKQIRPIGVKQVDIAVKTIGQIKAKLAAADEVDVRVNAHANTSTNMDDRGA
jgi:hypothetical protein